MRRVGALVRIGPQDRWRKILLALLLGVLALVTLEPHVDPAVGRARLLPIHMDEYFHWGMARAIDDRGVVTISSPFAGGTAGSFSPAADLHERGFQLYLALVQMTTGLDWVWILAALPVAVALFLGLATYVLAERWGAGLASVAWLIAIPTSLRFLGPGFAVPIAFSFPLVIVTFDALLHRRARFTAVAALVAGTLWLVHVMAAVVVLVLALGLALARLARRDGSGALLAAVIAAPCVLAVPYVLTRSSQATVDPTLGLSLDDVHRISAIGCVLAAAGAYSLVASRDKRWQEAGFALGLAALLLLVAIIHAAATGIDIFQAYDRSVTLLPVIVALLAGAGSVFLAGRTAALARDRPAVIRSAVVVGIVLLFSAPIAVAEATQYGQETYEVLTPARYDEFVAAAPHLTSVRTSAIVDGVPTMAFTDITGLPTAYVFLPGGSAQPREFERFFANGATDTAFIISNQASVVVTDRPVANPDLVAVAPGVYVLSADLGSAG